MTCPAEASRLRHWRQQGAMGTTVAILARLHGDLALVIDGPCVPERPPRLRHQPREIHRDAIHPHEGAWLASWRVEPPLRMAHHLAVPVHVGNLHGHLGVLREVHDGPVLPYE